MFADFSPRTDAGREGLNALLRDPGHGLVALDFDGTLAPIVEDPEHSRLQPGAAAVLEHLADLVGLVAIVTGRPAGTALRLGRLEHIEGLVISGLYGAQIWRDGELTAPPPPPEVEDARKLLEEMDLPAGTRIEDKGGSVALHVRRAADPRAALAALKPVAADLAEETGLSVEPGRLVLELRPPGRDKGNVVEELVSDLGAESVLFAGDDSGDIAAYDAVDALRDKGIPGTLVCSDSEEVTVLAERADLIVDGPAGIVRLLSFLASRLDG